MIDMTYDPEADAAYIYIARGTVCSTEEAGPFVYDLDSDGKILGIELIGASQLLSGDEWRRNVRLPGAEQTSAAE